MPVTELVHFTGEVTPAYLATIRSAIGVQDKWCAENLSPTSVAPTSRGAAMFQQLDEPSHTLLTAHWDSAAEHGEWIASAENQRVFASVVEHIDLSKLVFFHVDGIAALPDTGEGTGAGEGKGEETPVPTLKAPVVGVLRYFVAPENKDEFERVFGGARAVYDEYAKPFVHRGGWRIEKESEDKEEFVLIGGWESVEKASEFSKVDGFKGFDEAIKAVVTGQDVKYYKRCL